MGNLIHFRQKKGIRLCYVMTPDDYQRRGGGAVEHRPVALSLAADSILKGPCYGDD